MTDKTDTSTETVLSQIAMMKDGLLPWTVNVIRALLTERDALAAQLAVTEQTTFEKSTKENK